MERRYERLRPEQLRAEKERAPVAYVPLGALEWHGWHLPAGLDALKARELCLRTAEETGGVVLPPFYYATREAEEREAPTIAANCDPELLRPLLEKTFRRLCEAEYDVIVSLTGHYPDKQTEMVKNVAGTVEAEHDATLIALPEHEAYTPETRRGHAGKWETSFLLYLFPDLVAMEEIDAHPEDPFRGVQTDPDPVEASAAIGREMTEEIVATLAERVESALDEPETGEQ